MLAPADGPFLFLALFHVKQGLSREAQAFRGTDEGPDRSASTVCGGVANAGPGEGIRKPWRFVHFHRACFGEGDVLHIESGTTGEFTSLIAVKIRNIPADTRAL